MFDIFIDKLINNQRIITATVSFFISLAAILLIYPFMNETLTVWEGEICESVLDGISFSKRISNFYILFLIVFPILFCIFNYFFIKIPNKITNNLSIKNKKISFYNLIHSIVCSSIISFFFLYQHIPRYDKSYGKKIFIINFVLLNKSFIFNVLLYIPVFLIFVLLFYKLNIKIGFYNKYEKSKVLFLDIVFLPLIALSYLFKLLNVNNQFIVDKLNISFSFETLLLIIGAIVLMYLCTVISNELNIYDCIVYYFNIIIFLKNYFIENSLFLIAISVILTFGIIYYENKQSNLFKYLLFAVLCSVAILPIINELAIIIFSNTKFLFNPVYPSLLIPFSISFGLFVKKIKINNSIYNFIALLSFLLIGYMYTKTNYIFDYRDFANVFELGNFTVASDTFVGGKIPILDYFPAHALLDIIYRLLYTVIYNDILGLFTDVYQPINSVLGGIVVYLLLTNFFTEEESLISVILFPFAFVGFKGFTFNLISVVLLCALIKNNNKINLFLFWFLNLISAFYQYDSGISLGIATIFVYAIYLLYKRQIPSLIKYIICGSAIGIIILLLCFAYSRATGFDIISRIFEWKSLTLNSFCSLAKTTFASSKIPYFFAYFFVPLSAIAIGVYIIFDIIKYKNFTLIQVIILSFIIAEITFIPRGVAFHNWDVCRGKTGVLLNYWPWTVSFFSVYCSETYKKNFNHNVKHIAFIASFMFCIGLSIVCVTRMPIDDGSTVMSTVVKNNRLNNTYAELKNIENYKRITETEETKKFYGGFKGIFDLLLKEDETFIDYANVTSLYAYVNKQRPFYVAQNPGLLSDINSQKEFVNEVKKFNCPIAILGDTATPYIQTFVGVNNNIRYTKASEYIFKNYRPLSKLGQFSIWSINDRYAKYVNLLNKYDYEILDYGYDKNELVNNKIVFNNGNYNDIRMLPYVVGHNKKKFDIMSEEKLVANLNDEYSIPDKCLHTDQAYIKVAIDSKSTQKGSAVLSNVNDKTLSYKIDFNILEGNNVYMIKISDNYLWYGVDIKTVRFEYDSKFLINEITICNMEAY